MIDEKNRAGPVNNKTRK